MQRIKSVFLRLLQFDLGRWQVFYFAVLGVFPAFVGSLILPGLLVPFTVGVSAWVAYEAFKGFQPELFEMTEKTSYFFFNLPFCGLCLGWAGLLVFLGRFEQVPRAVGPVILLLLVCVWPVYRFKKSNTERKTPFHYVYVFFCTIVIFQQGFVFWREIA